MRNAELRNAKELHLSRQAAPVALGLRTVIRRHRIRLYV